MSRSVAALEAAYAAAPTDPQCGRLMAACRDELAALRRGVDAFELAAADEEGDDAATELRRRRNAFDTCAARAGVRVRHAAAC